MGNPFYLVKENSQHDAVLGLVDTFFRWFTLLMPGRACWHVVGIKREAEKHWVCS